MKKILIVSALVLALLPLSAVYHKVGEIIAPEPVQAVFSANGIAYVADGASGLRFMDIYDPANPILCSVFPSNNAYLVTVSGSVAYLAEYDELKLIDVQDPYNPSLLGSYNTDLLGTVRSIAVSGSHLFAATYNGMYIIDVSVPQSPTLYSNYDLHAKSIAIIENIAYAICWESGEWTVLKIIDVSDPQNPDELASYDVNLAINSFAVDGNTAFIVADGSVLQLIDVSNPLQPALLSTFTPPGGAYSVAVEDDVAFLATGDRELYALDVSNPQNPTLLTNYDTFHGSMQTVTVAEHIAYTGVGSATLQLIDVSNPQNQALLGYYPTPQIACSVAVQGNIAYVAEFNFGLRIIDISDPVNPILLGSYPIWYGQANYVKVGAGIAYVGGGGLTILDVSDPQNPTFLAELVGILAQYSCCVAGSLAYTTYMGNDGFRLGITDVSDPQNPVGLGSYIVMGDKVTVAGSIAYVYGWCLDLIDVSVPSNPTQLGSWDALEGITSVAVAGNVVYATTIMGLHVIDVSNPSLPVQIGSYPLHATSDVNYCYINDNRLYVSDNGWNEISTYDISIPQTPVLIARYAWNLSMERGMCIDSGKMFTPDGGYGLFIHDLVAVDVDEPVQIPPSAFQMRNYPNPFNPETTIAYILPAAGPVSLDIYNSRGQLVKRLLNQEQPAGEHSLIWNGKDDAGNCVASGLYLCRIACNGKQETRKMLLLK